MWKEFKNDTIFFENELNYIKEIWERCLSCNSKNGRSFIKPQNDSNQSEKHLCPSIHVQIYHKTSSIKGISEKIISGKIFCFDKLNLVKIKKKVFCFFRGINFVMRESKIFYKHEKKTAIWQKYYLDRYR